MKRPQMVSKIYNFLKDKKDIDMMDCCVLLSLIEEDMLPPLSYIELFDKFDNAWED